MRKRDRAKLKRLKQQNAKLRRSLSVLKLMCASAIWDLRKNHSRLFPLEDWGTVFRKQAEKIIEKQGVSKFAKGGEVLFGKY